MYAQLSDIATILGLPATTTLLDLSARCEGGLPVECLLELADTMEPDKRGQSPRKLVLGFKRTKNQGITAAIGT